MKQFTCEYYFVDRAVSVRLNGRDLVFESQGQPTAALIPDRNDGFSVQGRSTTFLRFVSEHDQPAASIAIETPTGVFTAKRKAK